MIILRSKIRPQLILGVLNSRLISYWFVHKFGKMQRGIFPQFKVNELAKFPMPKTFEPYEQILVDKVDSILSAKRDNPKADTSELDKAVDQIVYKLFKLTPSEIVTIEA